MQPWPPRPDELIALVARCEAAGFELHVWIERIEYPDRKAVDYVRRLAIRDPGGRRRCPDALVLPLIAQARVIVGYLVRVRSPFFPADASEDDRRGAMACSIADERRLMLVKPRDVRLGDRWLPWHRVCMITYHFIKARRRRAHER
jgi:hypothetical protein